jgi:hypothetical protein
VFAVGSLAFSLVALVLAFAALVTAAQSESRSNDAKKQVAKLAAAGIVGSTAKITLQEFSIVAHPGLVQSGKVTLQVENVGTMIHELVIVRAASPSTLPLVTKPGGERSIGAIDEEAIPEADKMGESGDVGAGATVTKTFNLPAGTYVMFCNIDTKAGGTVYNHFKRGMITTLIAV